MKRVLLAEDSDTYATFLTKQLADIAAITRTKTAAEALHEVNANRCREYDLVVLDYFLPGQRSDEIVRAVKALSLAPVIVCSCLMKGGGILPKDDNLVPHIREALTA